jgi:hypothetical protein
MPNDKLAMSTTGYAYAQTLKDCRQGLIYFRETVAINSAKLMARLSRSFVL